MVVTIVPLFFIHVLQSKVRMTNILIENIWQKEKFTSYTSLLCLFRCYQSQHSFAKVKFLMAVLRRLWIQFCQCLLGWHCSHWVWIYARIHHVFLLKDFTVWWRKKHSLMSFNAICAKRDTCIFQCWSKS